MKLTRHNWIQLVEDKDSWKDTEEADSSGQETLGDDDKDDIRYNNISGYLPVFQLHKFLEF